MWEQDWALLGIEQTTDLVAIKKAYALKLKVTRPDDDAEAYQALRSVYERATQWAKWTREANSAPDALRPIDPPPTPPARSAQDEADPPPAPLPDDEGPVSMAPQMLVTESHALWSQQGDAALVESWPLLHRQLEHVALGQGGEASAVFAHWVLSEPRLPDTFVSALNEHFGWLGDFRAERQIGTTLVSALHDALDGRMMGQTAGAELQRQAAPILHLYRILDRWWGSAAALLAAAVGPGLERLYASLDAGSRRRLGLRDREQTHLATAFDMAFVLRLGCCLLPMALFGLSISQNRATWGWSMAGWLICALGGLGFALGAGACFKKGFGVKRTESRYREWLRRLRHQRWAPWLALTLLGAAIWLSASGYATQHLVSDSTRPPAEPIEGVKSMILISSQPLRWAYWIDLLLPITLGLAGLIIGWPLATVSGQVIAGQVLLLTYVAHLGIAGADAKRGLEGPDVMVAIQGGITIATTWLACWTWLLVGALIYEQRLPRWGWLPWLVRPVTNVLAMGERWGLRVGLAPAMTICGLLWMLPHGLQVSTTLFLWAAIIIAVGYVQNNLERHGLNWLERLAARS
jgi:hypothetical protein